MTAFNEATRQKLVPHYMETDYHIPDLNTSLIIGQHNKTVDSWLSKQGATHAVFITAYNPNSLALSPSINQKSNSELSKLLSACSYLPASGIPKNSTWIPEESFLVKDLPMDLTLKLMHKFGQLAVVWHSFSQASHLLWRDGSVGP